MPNYQAALQIICAGVFTLAIGCSSGSTGPEPSNSSTKSDCTPNQYQGQQQAGQQYSGTAGQQQPQNQSTASANSGTGGVYTLQNDSSVTVWGTTIARGNTSALIDLLISKRADGQAADSEYRQAIELVAAWGGNSTSPASNNGTVSNPTANNGFNNSTNSGNSRPCL